MKRVGEHKVPKSFSRSTQCSLPQALVPAFLARRKHRNTENFAEYFTAEENTEGIVTQKLHRPTKSCLRQAHATKICGFGW